MSTRPWYKHYPSDFISGCMTAGMRIEEIGGYIMLLDMIYDRDGPIPNETIDLARMCGCSKAQFKKVLARLTDLGKIVETDGYLDNPRAVIQRKKEEKEQLFLQNSGKKGGKKSQKRKRELRDNNELAEKGLVEKTKQSRSQIPEPEGKTVVGTTTENNNKDRALTHTPKSDDLELALAAYNSVAKKIGRPAVQSFNPTRKKKLQARLTECGGLEGWDVAMGKVEASEFLRHGGNDWPGVTFDFLMQPSSFAKLMEGNYDNQQGSNTDRKRGADSDERARRRDEAIHRAFRPGSQPGEAMAGSEPERAGCDPDGRTR